MTATRPELGRRPSVSDLTAAFILGIATALSLSTLMLVAQTERVSGVPMPLGVAFAARLFGASTLGPRGALPVGLLLHTGYVAAATVVAVALFRRRLGAAMAFGTALVLWLVAGLTVVPYVGWGSFGAGVGGHAVLGLLAVHAVYGLFLWVGLWALFHSPARSPLPVGYPLPSDSAGSARDGAEAEVGRAVG